MFASSSFDDRLAGAVARHQAGDLRAALDLYGPLLEAAPDHPALLRLIGTAAAQLGRPDTAARFLERAVVLAPGDAEALGNLGTVRRALGDADGAEAAFRAAMAADPANADPPLRLAMLLADTSRPAEAEAAFRAALAIAPELPEALHNLAHLLCRQGRPGAAYPLLLRALAVRADYPLALNTLGTVLGDLGRPRAAFAILQRAVDGAPQDPRLHSNLLAAAQYLPGQTEAGLADLHAVWAERHAMPVPPRPAPVPHPGPLRIGFVSADMGRHPVGVFLLGLLSGLAGRAECVLYANRTARDAVTEALAALATAYVPVAHVGDGAVADRIRADAIDVLVDLSGHTAGNRLGVFARRPAPLQLTWAGYVGTTGLVQIDGLVADAEQMPAGSDLHCTEAVLRLPGSYVCWQPPATAPPVGPLPADTAGTITFGSLNNPAKLSAATLAQWAAVLSAVPGSRLLLRYRGLDDPLLAARIRGGLGGHGIAPERVMLEGDPRDQTTFLDTYNRVDIGLDPQPYSGGLTTLEALHMGVPVVARRGATFAGRHAASHLVQAGLGDLVGKGDDDVVDRAAALASDRARLSALRVGLRDRLAASPVADAAGFADRFLAAVTDLARGLGVTLPGAWS